MSEQELTQPKIEPIKKERLTDEEMGNLISAFGNSEAKAITLLAMRDGRIYTRGDLHRAVLSAQGETGWRIGTTVPFDYCSHSLAPIGLVVRGIVNPDVPDSPWGYQLTDYGKSKGTPLCGLLLDWSRKHNISLFQLFRNTLSTSPLKEMLETKEGEGIEFRKRAPITILKILYEVVTSPNLPVRQVDIADRISEDHITAGRHIVHLSRRGLIQYQSTEANTPFSAYKITPTPPGEFPIFLNERSLTNAIFSILKEHPDSYLTIQEIYERLPQALEERGRKRRLASRISSVLAFLRRNKYAEVKKFSADSQSEINLTDEQRLILTDLVEIIDRFQDQDPEIITRGRQLAEDIINNPFVVSALMRRAKETSPYANRSSALETRALINYIISSHPGITNREIQHLLELEGKRLSQISITVLTRSLEKEDAIRTVRDGSVKKFFPFVLNS